MKTRNAILYGIFAILALAVSNPWLASCAGGAPAKQAAYFTGDGGKGRSITILPPRGSGLAANQAYLPDLVANELVSNFRSFSAMTLFDRVNNQRQYEELLSGYYSDNDKAGLDLGHLASTDYMLLGNITKTSTGYALQLTVNRNSDKTTAAAYSGTISIAELDDLTGVRRASLDLLQKMGVQVTEQARTELTRAAETNRVNAQTTLAQGIVAQRRGNVVETMAKFYEAANYDPSLAEAAARARTMSASIRTGSFGENLRNDLAWRNEWVKIINDARRYLQNTHFVVARLEYGQLKQGKINYQEGTVEYTFNMRVSGAPYPQAYLQIMKDINEGLRATRRNRDWKLIPLTWKNVWGIKPGLTSSEEIARAVYASYVTYYLDRYNATRPPEGSIVLSGNAELINSNGKVVDQLNIGYGYTVLDGLSLVTGYFPIIIVFNSSGTISRTEISLNINGKQTQSSFTVKADDITDEMSIRINASAGRHLVQVTQR
ncbi:MAG: hypothetical protein LBQ89_03635 [Treponema sp.]|jgi:hypothetical protein|nr:hypothetical protein [Treponema sp.]